MSAQQHPTQTQGSFAETPQFTPVAPCATCRHKVYSERRCTAFPNGIPDPFTLGRHRHRAPYPGDNAIQYQPKPNATTTEPIRYAELLHHGEVRGALWVDAGGTAMGVLSPHEGTQRHWSSVLQTAWQAAGTPNALFAYWTDSDRSANGLVYQVGPMGEAISLAELAARIVPPVSG